MIDSIRRGFQTSEPVAVTPRFTFRGNNAKLQTWIEDAEHRPAEIVLDGPSECVAGETRIYNPITGEMPTIGDLYRSNTAPIVMTQYGWSKASVPFRKGVKRLYRVTLSSGKSFVATEGHRVLTLSGWKFIGEVLVGESLTGFGVCHPLTTSGFFPSMSWQDDRRSLRTIQDYQSSCSACCHRCGERPRADQDSGQVFVPSPNDVRAHSRADRSWGDPISLSGYIHPRPQFDHQSSGHFYLEGEILQMDRGECCASRCIDECHYDEHEEYCSSELGMRLLNTSYESMRHVLYRQCLFPCEASCDYYKAQLSTVSSIKYERTDEYFDLTVPVFGHYWAEGAWHHNTGKSIACLAFVDAMARTYPKARMAIVRQFHVDLGSTIVDLFKRNFVEPAGDIDSFGGEDTKWFDYPNGTRIYCVGMDRPGKVLSGALDLVYFNQAEEAKEEGWQILSTRTTGRAGAIVPGVLLGDMNPAPPAFWLYAREQTGAVTILPTKHKDNPSLYDAAGELTTQGRLSLNRLSALTGVLKSRLFEGKRVSAEGLIYSEVWDENDGCVTEEADFKPDAGPIYWFADDGYSAGSAQPTRGISPQTHTYVADAHPRVFLLVQMLADGRLNVFAEDYECLMLTEDHIAKVRALSKEKGYPDPVLVTHGPGAAEFRGKLHAAGFQAYQCKAEVKPSIMELRSALAKDENGVRLIRVHPRCRHLRAEMVAYSYKPGSDEPLKQFDHGPDALRGGKWVLRNNR